MIYKYHVESNHNTYASDFFMLFIIKLIMRFIITAMCITYSYYVYIYFKQQQGNCLEIMHGCR